MVSPSMSLSTLARDVRDVQSALKPEDDHSKLEVKSIAEIEQDALMDQSILASRTADANISQTWMH